MTDGLEQGLMTVNYPNHQTLLAPSYHHCYHNQHHCLHHHHCHLLVLFVYKFLIRTTLEHAVNISDFHTLPCNVLFVFRSVSNLRNTSLSMKKKTSPGKDGCDFDFTL